MTTKTRMASRRGAMPKAHAVLMPWLAEGRPPALAPPLPAARSLIWKMAMAAVAALSRKRAALALFFQA
jgi:hypothetical protein